MKIIREKERERETTAHTTRGNKYNLQFNQKINDNKNRNGFHTLQRFSGLQWNKEMVIFMWTWNTGYNDDHDWTPNTSSWTACAFWIVT